MSFDLGGETPFFYLQKNDENLVLTICKMMIIWNYGKEDKTIEKYLTPEELRKKLKLNQTDFAKLIDMPIRTYLERLYGNHPKWTIGELEAVCRINKGKIRILGPLGEFQVTVKKID